MKTFKAIKDEYRNGMQITFANGNTISIQSGTVNYCDDCTCEIAIRDKDGNWHNFGNDTVKGWVSPEELPKCMEFAATQKISTIGNMIQSEAFKQWANNYGIEY